MKALIVIDMQNGLVKNRPWKIDVVTDNIATLISTARANNIEVIYVSHTVKGSPLFEPGTENWEIIELLKPRKNEKVFEKNYSSSFKETGLNDYLEESSITTLIMTGMQTEKCFDTAVRVAFEFGYQIIVPELTNTTFDTKLMTAEMIYEHHNFEIFNQRFAQVVTFDASKELLIGDKSDEI